MLYAGTNDSVSRTSREIFDDLLQLKSVTTMTLPNWKVISFASNASSGQW